MASILAFPGCIVLVPVASLPLLVSVQALTVFAGCRFDASNCVVWVGKCALLKEWKLKNGTSNTNAWRWREEEYGDG